MTTKLNAPCAVTADCLPILLCNEQEQEIAIHADLKGEKGNKKHCRKITQ